jgi:hypothetical protein
VTERPDGSSSPTTGAKRLLELFAVIAFYLYFGGWVYANDLLSSFGINLAAVAPQTQYFVVYAYSVFFASPGNDSYIFATAHQSTARQPCC